MNKLSSFILCALATALLVLGTVTACAVTSSDGGPHRHANGRIEGTVTDAARRPLQGATVGIDRTTAQGPIREILPVTNEEGRFVWPDLPPGTYTLRAAHAGYKDATREVEVKGDETTQVEFVLAAAGN